MRFGAAPRHQELLLVVAALRHRCRSCWTKACATRFRPLLSGLTSPSGELSVALQDIALLTGADRGCRRRTNRWSAFAGRVWAGALVGRDKNWFRRGKGVRDNRECAPSLRKAYAAAKTTMIAGDCSRLDIERGLATVYWRHRGRRNPGAQRAGETRDPGMRLAADHGVLPGGGFPAALP